MFDLILRGGSVVDGTGSPMSRADVGIEGGKITAVAAVTMRFKPFKMNGKIVHEIGIPWHWGYEGVACGGSANSLTPHVGDANTMIPEYKALLCNVKKEVS